MHNTVLGNRFGIIPMYSVNQVSVTHNTDISCMPTVTFNSSSFSILRDLAFKLIITGKSHFVYERYSLHIYNWDAKFQWPYHIGLCPSHTRGVCLCC